MRKKGAVLLIALACGAVVACKDAAQNENDEDAVTSADANSVQDPMVIETDPGGGMAFDTSGTGMVGTGPDSITSTVEPRLKSPQDTSKVNVYSQ